MTVKTIIKELTKREGLKKSIDIAQVTELVGHLSDLIYENYLELNATIDNTATKYLDVVFYNNGAKRAKKKKEKTNATTK